MNVTRFTDYSMRVLIYLAVNNNALATIKEIAQRYGISNDASFVSSVLHFS